MARVAVTGATGFLGWHIAEELNERGHDVVAVVRSPHKAAALEAQGVTVKQADLTDPPSLQAGFAGCDVVVANAAQTTAAGGDYAHYVRTNREGTANQIQAAENAGVPRLVYISTIAVYRTALRKIVSEDHPRLADARFDWSWVVSSKNYSKSKALAEELVWEARDRGLRVIVLRPGPIYGPNGGRLTDYYARAMRLPVAPAPTVRMPHVHARDVAIAVAGAVVNPDSDGRAYNVTGPSVSPLQVLRALKHRTGAGPFLVPVPVPMWTDYDDSDAERDLGFAPRGAAEGLQQSLAERD